jgi:hypothetical protein
MRAHNRTLPGRPGIGQRAFDVQPILVHVLLIAGIGDRRELDLRDDLRALLWRELENRQSLVNFLTGDQLADEPKLLR